MCTVATTTSNVTSANCGLTPTVLPRRSQSPRREGLQRPAGALRVRLDIRVRPDLAHAKNSNWVRKTRTSDQDLNPAFRDAQQLDQFPEGDHGRRTTHAHNLLKSRCQTGRQYSDGVVL